MDYEKLYKDALSRAKNLRNDAIDMGENLRAKQCEIIFPELKGSGDEEIRKDLIRLVEECTKLRDYYDLDKMKAWLEKQGEPNPYSGVSFEYNGHIWGMCARDNGVDILLDKKLFKHLEKQGEQVIDANKMIEQEWSEEDERIRKSIIELVEWVKEQQIHTDHNTDGTKWDDMIAWLEKQASVKEIVERCKNSWYNEGKIAGMAEGLTDDEKYQQGWHDALEKQGEQKPAENSCKPSKSVIEKEDMTEYNKGFECGKQRVLKYPEDFGLCKNSAWSKEDERILTNLIDYINIDDALLYPVEQIIDWFKSLKERIKNVKNR